MRRVTLAVPALLAGCASGAPAESATATHYIQVSNPDLVAHTALLVIRRIAS